MLLVEIHVLVFE